MKKLIACGALLALSSCDCGGTKTNASEGELKFASDLQFGILAVGETLTRTATLENVGGGRVVVEGFEVASPFSACVAHQDGSCTQDVELEVGAQATVSVTYAPTAANATDAENHASEVVAVNDSPVAPRVKIHVVGHAVPARLSVDPVELDFGTLEVGDVRPLELRFANKGVQPIALSNAAIDEGAFQADLTAVPATLERDGTFTLTVTYAPQQGRDDSGALTVTTDIAVQSQVRVPLKGAALLAQVKLCYGFEGAAQACLPDALGGLAGELDFGALDAGASKRASLTLVNEGNVQVELFGLADSKGAQVVDATAAKNPCGLAEPVGADFTFAPASFGAKLPEDPTAQQPDPPKQQTMLVTYSPSHHCAPQGTSAGDVADRGVLSLKAGTRPSSPSFFLDLKGYSKVGLAKAFNVAWDSKTPAPQDYRVFNTGQGPLDVSAVELVEADALDCASGCEARAPCSAARPECALFGWSAGPTAIQIAGAPAGGQTEGVVGTVTYTPGAFCGAGADAGACFPTQTVRVCTRVTTDDPFRPKICGELQGRTY